MIKELPGNSIWSAGGIGNWQLKMNAMAIIEGGGVRIGLEDNILWMMIENISQQILI